MTGRGFCCRNRIIFRFGKCAEFRSGIRFEARLGHVAGGARRG